MSIAEFTYDDVSADVNTYGQLNVFGYVFGYVDPGDADWYRAYLVAGTTYVFDMFDWDSPAYSGDYPFDSLLRLLDGSGRLILTGSEDQTSSADPSRVVFTPTSSGIYYLSAEGYLDSGSYIVTMSTTRGDDDIPEDLSTTRRLSTTTPVSSAIDLASDVDWLVMSLKSGTAYTVSVKGALDSPLFSLFDADANYLGPIDVNEPFFVPDAGDYFLEVADSAFAFSGNYTVSLKSSPTLSFDTPLVDETATSMRFTITLSEPSATAITFVARTLDTGTATAGSDFIATSVNLTIPAGRSSATFNVALRPDTVFEPTEWVYVGLSNIVGASAADGGYGFGFVFDDDAGKVELPTDTYVTYQWHLYPTIGANVLPVWDDYTGRGVKVAVFDQGIDRSHPDLKNNVLTSAGRDAATLLSGGDPKGSGDNHGTAVAGVIAADRNGIDGVGVAYGADLVSIYSPLLLTDMIFGDVIANAYTYALGFDVLNDSWGFAPQSQDYAESFPWAFLDNFRTSLFYDEGEALRQLAEQGRDGLGTIVVQSAGNSYAFGDDTNLHNFQNSRYIITVAATDYKGNATSYSSPGASILIAAPGGGGDDPLSDIWTTDRVGNNGYDSGDFTSITGTSFSSPLVSGVVALMLEANPNLGYRDVQQILAYSARITGREANDWEYNGAANWNGGGLHYDAVLHDLGFGLVDARAAVRLAESWQSTPATSANDVQVTATRNQVQTIPDGVSGLTQSITITQPIDVERVEVTIQIDHPYLGDLGLLLTSPSGTDSWLLWRAGQNALSAYGSDQSDIDFTFNTVLSMGESSLGRWDLSVFDLETGLIGTLQSWTLNLIGKTSSIDDVYVYTDEFSETLADVASRSTLSDSGGIDTINAAALSSKVTIDLAPNGPITIDGQSLKLAAGTVIENAWGGDVGDLLAGSTGNNQLFGGRGNDSMFGRDGNDTLVGGAGNDSLDCGAGVDTVRYDGARKSFVLTKGNNNSWTIEDKIGGEGRDTVTSWERIEFRDIGIAYDLDGTAGQTAQIIRGLFGAAFLTEEAYVGIGIDLLDNGLSYLDVVTAAIGTDLFASLAGSRSNADFVRLLWANVIGGSPSASNLNYYTSLLDSGVFTQATLGVGACMLPENVNSADLIGLASTGIEYLPVEHG